VTSTGEHRGSLDSLPRAVFRWVSTIAPDVDGVCTTSTPTRGRGMAEALAAEKLLMLTDVEGLYTSWPDRGSLVSEIDVATLTELLPTLESAWCPRSRPVCAR